MYCYVIYITAIMLLHAGLTILYQSPRTIVLHGGDEAALYCVVNVISMLSLYTWHTPGAFSLPSSPVVYVKMPGVYFCTVTHDKEEVISDSVRVRIIPGNNGLLKCRHK